MATKPKKKATPAEVAVLPQRPMLPIESVMLKFHVRDEDTVREFVRRGIIPPPIKISRKCSRWYEDVIDQALAKLVEKQAA